MRRRRTHDLSRRLERLEKAAGPGCADCASRIEVVFRGEEEEAEARCPRCHRELLTVVVPFVERAS